MISDFLNATLFILPNEFTITHLFLYTIVYLIFLSSGLYYLKRISPFSFVHFLIHGDTLKSLLFSFGSSSLGKQILKY